MRSLKGKTAVITGGSSGIGRATAHRFAEEGVNVVVTDIDTSGGEETVKQIESRDDVSGTASFRQLDVSDYNTFETVLLDVAESLGSVDILFNNAGVGEMQSFEETTPGHVEDLIDVNVMGVWNGCHAVLPIMKANNGGSIINTSSRAGWQPTTISSYALTKAAVLHLTRCLGQELGNHNIRINAICPGPIQTQMTDHWYTDEMKEETRDKTALNRWGKPEEIAACVAFLASEEASFVTGRAIEADGGLN